MSAPATTTAPGGPMGTARALPWLVGMVGSMVATAAGAVEFRATGSVTEAAEAVAAAVLALAVAGLALSLPGRSGRGMVIGGFFVTAGMLSWSYSDRPLAVWGLMAVEGLVFIWWGRPWLRHLRTSLRVGGAWLGVSYWLLGIVGALLIAHLGVAAERLAYAGVFGLAVMAVIASADQAVRRDLTVGVVSAFLLAMAALLVSGSGNLFDSVHTVVKGPWGEAMNHRFWGGPGLLYHPNSLACIAVATALRVGPDGRFSQAQRLAVTGVAGFFVYMTNSRTGFVFLGAGACLHALLLWWRRWRVVDLPEYRGRARWVAAATPFAALALVLALSGGSGFLFQERYGSGGLTSGRTATWAAVGRDWVHAGIAEKVFGDAQTTRAVVIRQDSGTDVKLTTDNAAVGALRRGGVLGVGAFLVGLGLLARAALRRTAPGWFLIVTAATLPTIAVADWMLGGTGGTLWVLLLSAEVMVGAAGQATVRTGAC